MTAPSNTSALWITYDNFYIPYKGRLIIEIGSFITEAYVVDGNCYYIYIGDETAEPDLTFSWSSGF